MVMFYIWLLSYVYDNTVRLLSIPIALPPLKPTYELYTNAHLPTQPALYALWRSFMHCVYLEPASVDLDDPARGAGGEGEGSRMNAGGSEGEDKDGAECKGKERNEAGSERKREGAVLFFRRIPAIG